MFEEKIVEQKAFIVIEVPYLKCIVRQRIVPMIRKELLTIGTADGLRARKTPAAAIDTIGRRKRMRRVRTSPSSAGERRKTEKESESESSSADASSVQVSPGTRKLIG